MVEAKLAEENLGELHGRLSGCFARVEPRQQARKYITGLMSDLPRKNCWAIAEHAGDRTPDRMQRLLNDAVWDTTVAMGIIRRFVAEHLAPAAGGCPSRRWTRPGRRRRAPRPLG
jgi:SRSO17 transposase